MSTRQRGPNLTRTVARNTYWSVLDLTIAIVSAFLTSIPVARIIGPEKLGYFTYVQWLTNVTALLGLIGIPAATAKYMAEYLGRGEPGVASRVFWTSLKIQTAIAAVLGAAGIVVVALYGNPSYRAASMLLVIAAAVKMVACIPSNANVAGENFRANFPGALANNIAAVVLINAGLLLGWGLTGVALGVAVGISLELAGKMICTLRWLHPARGAVLPPELRQRMVRFSGQSLILMSVNLVVWDRSDVVFLKLLDKDIRQVAFFGLAFNITERLLMIPRAFSSAVGASVLAEYGRDRARVARAASLAAKYGLLAAVPMMATAAALSGPLIRLLYGAQYVPAIPVLAIATMLAVAKPLLPAGQNAMQAAERQGFLIWWNVICAVLNVALDVILIPVAGAKGAMLANGTAQALAIGGIWIKIGRVFPLEIPGRVVGKFALAGLAMAAVVWPVGFIVPGPVLQLVTGALAGTAIYVFMIRELRILDEVDHGRFADLARRLPPRGAEIARRVLRLLVPPPPVCPVAGNR